MATAQDNDKKTKQNPTIVALVPMRHSSERVVGKNYRDMAGKPLFHHIIGTLLACPEISKVVVDTDSDVIMKGLEENFPAVVRLKRPENLRDGNIPMNDILIHDTSQVEADYYLQTHSTNPILKSATVSRAIRAFLDGRDEHDSLFAVTRLQTRLYDRDGKAMNHNPNELIRTQDLPPVYEENSNIYIFDRETLLRRQHRMGDRPMMFEVDAAEAMDIDVETDFTFCDLLLRQQQQQQQEQK